MHFFRMDRYSRKRNWLSRNHWRLERQENCYCRNANFFLVLSYQLKWKEIFVYMELWQISAKTKYWKNIDIIKIGARDNQRRLDQHQLKFVENWNSSSLKNWLRLFENLEGVFNFWELSDWYTFGKTICFCLIRFMCKLCG